MSPAAIEIGATAAGGLLLAGLTTVAIRLYRASRAFGLFIRDWQGEPERPGVTRTPGVMERLQTIEDTQADMKVQIGHVHYELKPNGGYSAKDQLNRLDPAFPPPVVNVVAPGGVG